MILVPPSLPTDRLKEEWASDRLSKTTRAIVLDVCLAAIILGWVPALTSIWRSNGEDDDIGGSGIHPLWRAVDARTRDVNETVVSRVVAHVNSRWIYDPTRPSLRVVVDKLHGTGPHLHIQSHPRTAFVG